LTGSVRNICDLNNHVCSWFMISVDWKVIRPVKTHLSLLDIHGSCSETEFKVCYQRMCLIMS